MTLDQIRDLLRDYDDVEILLADGFEDAFIGVCNRFGQQALAAYDYDKRIDILMTRDEMTEEDAVEHFSYNVIGGWAGEGTPVFITMMKAEESRESG